MKRTFRRYAPLLLLALLGSWGSAPVAGNVYLSQEDFLAETFDGKVPPSDTLWLIGSVEEKITSILGHAPNFLRVRYWQRGNRTAWILEEIGKEKPITAGFIVEAGEIQDIAILAYRESRGDEVRHDFFTRQFGGARLRDDGRLDQQIDGIVGATLSVNSIERLARLSLYLSLQVTGDG